MRDEELGIVCPDCGERSLFLRLSCLVTHLVCPGCRKSFSVEELAPRLDEETFERLAVALGRRLSDRV